MKYLLLLFFAVFSTNTFAAKTACDHVYDQTLYVGKELVTNKGYFNDLFGEVMFERITKLPMETQRRVIWAVVQVPKMLEEDPTDNYEWIARSAYGACRQQ